MKERLIAYLLDDLPEEERAEVETLLQSDPEVRNELERLRGCLNWTENDPEALTTPPDDLSHRTCDMVRKAAAAAKNSPSPKVAAGRFAESVELAGNPCRWSWTDITVATGILLGALVLILPALYGQRETARRMTCQNNLYFLGRALANYAEISGGRIPRIAPDENAGMYTVYLAESGAASPPQIRQRFVCPTSELADKVFAGDIALQVPTRRQLAEMSGIMLQHVRECMGGSYAFSLGYRDEQGNFRQIPFAYQKTIPLLADAPSFHVPGFQSANHGACGQNVIFHDLHASYRKVCFSEGLDNHWYLNDEGKPAAGHRVTDIVLGRSEYSPRGPLTGAAK